jgi:hypothetical protein
MTHRHARLRKILVGVVLPVVLLTVLVVLTFGGGTTQSLGRLPIRFQARFVDHETGEPIQGVEVFVAYSEEHAAAPAYRTEVLGWFGGPDVTEEARASQGLAISGPDGSVDILIARTVCYRSDEPYRSWHDADRVQPFQSVRCVWTNHPDYGERVISTSAGVWTGPTHHRDFDEGPWGVDLGTIRLKRME